MDQTKSAYELPKNEVQDKVEKILNTPNLTCPHKDLILSALILYGGKNIDYIDAYNALILKENGIEELYFYDRVARLTRLEP